MRFLSLVCAMLIGGIGPVGGCSRPRASNQQAASRQAMPARTVPATDPDAMAPAIATMPPELDALLHSLETAADAPAKVQALDAVAIVGKRAPAAGGTITTFARDEDADVRWHAARTLGMVGPGAESATPTLVSLLTDRDPVVAAQAAHALGLVAGVGSRGGSQEGDETVVEPLIRATEHADPRVRRAAVKSLRRVASPRRLADLLDEHLADADPSVVMPALHTLADLREESVPLLCEALKRPQARYWAAVAAAEIGPDAAPAVPQLTELAASGELDERMQAMFALAAIGEPAAGAAPTLIEALESSEEILRFAAAFALGKVRAQAASEPLAATASASDPFLAAVASWALARIHPDDPARVSVAVEKLRGGLSAAEATIRAGSINGLSDLASSLDQTTRRNLAADYVRLLDDPDHAVGTAAGGALVRLGADAAEPLRRELSDMATRMRAMEILAAQGEAAKPLVNEMLVALEDDDAAYASEAAVAIASVGPAAAGAVETLRGRLTEDVPAPVRYAAMYALGRIGTAAATALPRLEELARSKDVLEATVAIWAALKINPEDRKLFESAIPLLCRALESPQELARLEAAVSLGDIGSAASAAVPALEMLAEDDPSRSVREAAAVALDKIAQP